MDISCITKYYEFLSTSEYKDKVVVDVGVFCTHGILYVMVGRGTDSQVYMVYESVQCVHLLRSLASIELSCGCTIQKCS